MRKSALVLAIVMVAAAASPALAAKKKAKAADPNAGSKAFVMAAWQQPVIIWQKMWQPWWVAPAKKKA